MDLEQLKSYGLPIMIDFGADSYIPCKEMVPVLKDLNVRLQGKAIIRFVDWHGSHLHRIGDGGIAFGSPYASDGIADVGGFQLHSLILVVEVQ